MIDTIPEAKTLLASELMFTNDFTLETPYLTSCESFCVSIKFLLHGQMDISNPSDFCENIITHMDTHVMMPQTSYIVCFT